MNHYDAVVIGGGVTGLATALMLSKYTDSVAVIDKNSFNGSVNTLQRHYAINHASERLLKQLGVWDLLSKETLSPYQYMHIWDEATHACIDFDARVIHHPHLGHIFLESTLKNALVCALKATSVRLVSEFNVNDIHKISHQDWQITSDKMCIDTSLMCICDGVNSAVRKKLAIPMHQWDYHQSAIVASVKSLKPHQKTAYQVFTDKGPLAWLPLANPHMGSMVWSCPTSFAKEKMTSSIETFNALLSHHLSAKLGGCELLDERHSFPLTMRHVKRYFGDGWLILGDAAHSFHPLAGLGLNVGFSDVSVLHGLLENQKSFNITPSMMAAYQRHRKAHIWPLIIQLQLIKEGFAHHSILNKPRAMILNQFNRSSILKKLFIQVAEMV